MRGKVVTSNRYYVCFMTYVHDLPKVFLALMLETEDRERVAAWSGYATLYSLRSLQILLRYDWG
jgi:hypothetical protein